jgi:hypothetical protein
MKSVVVEGRLVARFDGSRVGTDQEKTQEEGKFSQSVKFGATKLPKPQTA